MSDIISGLIKREGGESNDPTDKGGHTVEGISEASNPDLFVDGHVPTDAEVRARYEERYIQGPGFAKIGDAKLRVQLIDFGVNSGPAIAIKHLQRAVGVTEDGVLGPATLAAVAACDPKLLNNALVRERVIMIGRICQKNPSQLKFLVGWLDRSLQFLS